MGMSKMGRVLVTASALALAAGAANAGGIDRSGQSIAPLFEKGGYAELSFGMVNPSVSGKDLAIFGGRNSQNVGKDYLSLGFAYKQDINDQLSYAIIYEKPFGADLSYASVANGGSVAFGGTKAHAGYDELSAILRYKFNDNMSAYGGLRISRASGDVTLKGAAYGGLSGYNANFSNDTGYGYVVGVAYEKPEIALRVALTYHSAIKHEHDTKETISGFPIGPVSTTEVSTPQSVNLDVQSGIAPGWLAFGQIRWVDWSEYDIDPLVLTKATNGGVFVKGRRSGRSVRLHDLHAGYRPQVQRPVVGCRVGQLRGKRRSAGFPARSDERSPWSDAGSCLHDRQHQDHHRHQLYQAWRCPARNRNPGRGSCQLHRQQRPWRWRPRRLQLLI
jgi:long-chain fatty acid transport protein